MSGFLSLLKLQFYGLFGINKTLHNKAKNSRNKLFWGLVVVIILAFLIAISMASYVVSMALIMYEEQMLDVFLQTMISTSALLCGVFIILRAQAILFGGKDFEYLQSIPVKTSQIIASKQVVLYIVAFLMSNIIFLPAFICYGIFLKMSIIFYLLSILTMFLLPLIPMLIGELLAVILSVVSSKSRVMNFVWMLIYAVLLGGYIVLSFNLSPEVLIKVSNVLTIIYPVNSWIVGYLNGDIISCVWFILSSLTAVFLMIFVVAFLYTKVNYIILNRSLKTKFKLQDELSKNKQKKSSVFLSIYKKEFGLSFSSIMVALNIYTGILMSVVLSVACIFFKDMIMLYTGGNVTILAIAIGWTCGMISMTSSTISLEGKQFWFIKSSPIPSKTLLSAKLFASMTIPLIASIINGAIVAFAFGVDVITWLLLLLIPSSWVIFGNVFGLLLNIKFPKLDYQNIIQVVKQSVPVMITVFTSMFILFVLGGVNIVFLEKPLLLYSVDFAVVFAFIISSAIMSIYIFKNSDKLLNSIE